MRDTEGRPSFRWHSSSHICKNATMMIYNYCDENNNDSAAMFLP